MNPETIKYIRLQNSDEILAYTEETAKEYVLTRPMLLFIVNYYEDGKQLLNFREYIPPTIVDEQTIRIPKKDVVFCSPVKEEFREQFIEMNDYFFETTPKVKTKTKLDEAGSSKKEKIVSIVEALMDKKGKPVH